MGAYADGLQTVFLVQIDNQSLATAGWGNKKSILHQRSRSCICVGWRLHVIYRNQDEAVLPEQLACDKEPRVNHREPGRVVTTTRLRVARQQVTLVILLAG